MSGVSLALAGGVGGLAWSASLRAYMVELAEPSSRVEWVGTFAQILLPGVVIGVLLGIAEHLRRTGGRPGWRWLAAAPALFAITPQFTPGALITLITTGIGSAAIAVSITGLLGGYAVSGRGPLWGRIAAGIPAFVLILGGAIATFAVNPRTLGLTEPRGVWVALLSASLLVVFVAACSIPHRAVVAQPSGLSAESAAA